VVIYAALRLDSDHESCPVKAHSSAPWQYHHGQHFPLSSARSSIVEMLWGSTSSSLTTMFAFTVRVPTSGSWYKSIVELLFDRKGQCKHPGEPRSLNHTRFSSQCFDRPESLDSVPALDGLGI
jgi:hypothetical protein